MKAHLKMITFTFDLNAPNGNYPYLHSEAKWRDDLRSIDGNIIGMIREPKREGELPSYYAVISIIGIANLDSILQDLKSQLSDAMEAQDWSAYPYRQPNRAAQALLAAVQRNKTSRN